MQVEDKCCEFKIKDSDEIQIKSKPFPAVLIKTIDNLIKKEGYIKYDVETKNISTDGGNYLGELHEVNIKGHTAEGAKETNIFVKYTIPDNGNNKIFSVTEAYFKESFMYKELSKIFNELQNEANIPKDQRFNMVKSYDETNTEAIILDNLAKQGYKTLHRMDVMPLKFAELSVKQLARYHGLFYVLQSKRPQYFDKTLKLWKNPFTYNEEWKMFMQNLCDLSKEGLDDNSKIKVEKFMSKMFIKFPYYYTSNTLPGCTICHGDYRVNNILVKEANGILSDVVPVDYQLLYYGNPLHDLIYLIFNASDREFRKNHLTNLKNLYYDTLENFLAYFDLDVNYVFPRKEFEKQYIERLDLGLMYGLYCTPFLFTLDDQVPDMGKDDVTKLNFVLDSRYRERIQGIVDDFVEWGYL